MLHTHDAHAGSWMLLIASNACVLSRLCCPCLAFGMVLLELCLNFSMRKGNAIGRKCFKELHFLLVFYNVTDTISHISQQCLGPLCAMRFVLSVTFASILLGPASNIWHSRIVQALVDTAIRLGLVSFLTCSSNFVPCLLLHWLHTTIWTVPLPFWCFPIFAVDTVLAA